MIPVEIRLKDFEAYIKNAKSFLRAIRILNISSLLLIVVSALLTTYLVIGVVFGLLIMYNILVMILPNWVAVKASYKEAKTFYKSLLDSEPCSFVPMHIEGSYNRDTLTYHFNFKPYSCS
jgi:hypothetical protein